MAVHSKIKHIEYYLPDKIVDNEILVREFQEWTPDKIEKKTGIKERHVCADNETSLDLAIEACTISLGMVETEMVQNLLDAVPEDARQSIARRHLLGMGTPGDVSHCCAFLLSDLSRWITGSSIVMDGGYSAA